MRSSSSSSLFEDRNYAIQNGKAIGRLGSFLFLSLVLTTILSFFFLYSPTPLKTAHDGDQRLLPKKEQVEEEERCDLFNGRWVRELRGSSQYTNWSCPTLPTSKNCFRHGRTDTEFLNWRWKPHNCRLPKFDAKAFLSVLRGKRLGFIGDSVARNHMDSLLCLLSQEETPVEVYKDSEDRDRIWYFDDHKLTVSIRWSKFLMVAKERMLNDSSNGSGVYDLHLDRVDERWAGDIPNLDYAIISTSHWFFRPIHLHDNGKVIGCVYCNEPNAPSLDPIDGIGMAFRAALRHINHCKQCNKKLVTVVRTFSPAHFENGAWNTGGICNRTAPVEEKDIDAEDHRWKLRNIQVKEIERAREEGAGSGKSFRVLDVTKAMLMRPDGHPGSFWGNKWMKGYNDCVHWCLPGPIDMWNDLLMQLLTKDDEQQYLAGTD